MTASDLLPLAQRLSRVQGWDVKMRELMLAGRELPVLEENQRTVCTEVKGCDSEVWIDLIIDSKRPQFRAYSRSKIIRGILSILLEKANHLTLHQVSNADFASYLKHLGLERYLSQSRGNGIRAVVERIESLAKSYH